MNNEMEVYNENSSHGSIEELASSLSTLVSEAKENIIVLLNNEYFKTTLDTLGDISQSLLDAISTIKVFSKVASIPTKLFMSKYERYAKGLLEIPYSKRQKYFKRVGNHGLNKDSIFILNILNKIEELSKIDILLALLEAKMDDTLDDISYRRLTIMVDRTLYSDLLYLRDNIKSGNIKIVSSEEEALLSNGYLLFAGIGFGSFTEEGETDDGGNLYTYTSSAKQLCKIVFKLSEIPHGNSSGGFLAIQTVSND